MKRCRIGLHRWFLVSEDLVHATRLYECRRCGEKKLDRPSPGRAF
jgi:peptide subunit release factor 1 (eRF1)